MKTYNPIRSTVTNFVTALGKRRKRSQKTKKSKIFLFFNDLENRGPFKPNSFFELWTKQIRLNMQKAGIWIREDEENNLAFVAEYIDRLQSIYLKDEERRFQTFKKIYLKVRIWGLRMKLFEIAKWEGSFFVARNSYVYPYYTPMLYRSDYCTYVVGCWGVKKIECKATKCSCGK
jgi:hypothetical protein